MSYSLFLFESQTMIKTFMGGRSGGWGGGGRFYRSKIVGGGESSEHFLSIPVKRLT